MIPIKNKKKNLEATIEDMRKFAFNYIEKFAPSKQQLKIYLLKKYVNFKEASVKKKQYF
jgi:regulatory protein